MFLHIHAINEAIQFYHETVVLLYVAEYKDFEMILKLHDHIADMAFKIVSLLNIVKVNK